MTDADKVISIFSKTRDGNDLSARDINLCQLAVNGQLSEQGKDAFASLYEMVEKGEYEKSWFYGIRHLTKSHDGYVSWKGKVVEHYSFRDSAKERQAAEELAQHCQDLEAKGIPVNGRTAISKELFRDAPAGTPWVDTMLNYYTFFADGAGKPVWAVFKVGDDDAVAVRMNNGQAELRYALQAEFESGCYRMYHQLQNEGYESCSDRVRRYADIEKVMADLGMTPEVVDLALKAPVPQPAEQPSTPSM